ncbi:MAG: UDP-2,3-diacylglucosamine diphosphatase [Bacteroidota bacterium]
MHSITLQPHKKIYFASDFHLGAPDSQSSKLREITLTKWLDSIKHDAQTIFLVGDLFDFWFEYKHVVPKGFLRFLGKIVELQTLGVEFIFFTGNHDLWMFDYFEKELGIKTYREATHFQISQKDFLIGHGDGLGPGDHSYKFLKKIFTSKICQFLFRWLHPDIGMWFGNAWSMDRKTNQRLVAASDFKTKEQEWLYQYSKEVEQSEHHDYYVFGHRHLALDIEINQKSRYINLGEWFISGKNTFADFDGNQLILREFKA